MYHAAGQAADASSVINNPLEYGSELGWATFGGQQPFGVATQMFQHMVFKNPTWDYKTLNFDADWAATEKAEGGVINALDPNLKPFARPRRQADSVPRLGGSADSHRQQRRLLQQRREGDGRPQRRPTQLPAVHGAGHGALRRRHGHVHLRHAGRARELGREEDRARHRSPRRASPTGRVDRTRPLCPYPAGRQLQGQRQRR